MYITHWLGDDSTTRLKPLFEMWDKDGSGHITRQGSSQNKGIHTVVVRTLEYIPRFDGACATCAEPNLNVCSMKSICLTSILDF